MKHKKKFERKKMLGNFIGKLDKNTCFVSLGIISFIALAIASTNLFSVFDISGVFKQ